MNSPAGLDAHSVRRWFDRASTTYAAVASLQGEVREELLARLEFFNLEPRTVLDLGAGLGEGTLALRRRFPRARVIPVDLSSAMLREGVGRRRLWRRPQALCADVRQLPLASGTVDLAFSNLMLQWCDLPLQAFAEIARVLRPGGLLLASTFGPLTLQELRGAWAAADTAPHVSQFPDLPELAGQLSAAGFQEPVLDIDQRLRHYPDALALQRELQALGARNADRSRRRSLTGKSRWQAMTAQYESLRTAQGLPASWELIYMAAFASGRTGSLTTSGEHQIPVGAIGRRSRP
jgi:malonyl-CoA O-methyltransferase